MKLKSVFGLFLGLSAFAATAQPGYWQQKVAYSMEIDFDVNKHQFTGEQSIVYQNNSPDTLNRVFYHLYFNAFQPGSMMDVRSRSIADPDGRVRDRILHLKDNEIGYHKIKSLKQNGKAVDYKVEGTILVVELNKPILPKGKATFDMEFESQVPKQIRRSGRNNQEGVDYSMTQWYPKMAEYDKDGWHSNPYVGREFHGVWGSFDVKITMDKKYVIGGTGYLQNPQEIGHGYEDKSKPVKAPKGDKLTWHFKAPQVHDFAWAADPDYTHDQMQVPNGPMLHFFYQTDTLVNNWKRLQPIAVSAFEIMSRDYGQYPFEQYSIIQGGDGGMEYPMATLITSHGSFGGLISVTVHEALHSWYQGVLATNESKFPWMDEGFTSFAQYHVLDELQKRNALNPLARSYGGYYSLVRGDIQEPLTTHADHFHLNRTYSTSSYSKGAIFLMQLQYIMGKEKFDQGLKSYFNQWKFKHPTVQDFKRVMEKTSGMELDWYVEQWVNTTNTIDYGIQYLESADGKTKVTLERVGKMPMPLDVMVYLKDGTQEKYYIPLRIMRGAKDKDGFEGTLIQQEAWPWTYPSYILNIAHPSSDIERIVIDPSTRLADVDSENDVWPRNADSALEGKAMK